MRQNVVLRIASGLSILFLMLHLVDDIIRGFEEGGVGNLPAIPILVLWLYGTLVLAQRRSGYVIMLVGGLLGAAIPVVHMRGNGLGVAAITESSGGFFFVFTTIALGVTALFSFILAAQGLWSGEWRQPRA